MQYSVHPPSRFICSHRDSLLPGWSRPVASILVVLQPTHCNLVERTPTVEHEKQQLRQSFLQFGYEVVLRLKHQGHLADIFDPRTGFPLLSPPGPLRLDDVAIAHACLGYEMVNHCGCWVIVHPAWGSAVYPSTLLSSAEPELVKAVSAAVGRTLPDYYQPNFQVDALSDRSATSLLRVTAG